MKKRLLRTRLIGIASLVCLLLPSAPHGEENHSLKMIKAHGVWREIVADAYRIKIYGTGKFELWMGGRKRVSGEYVERWKVYQREKAVRFPRASLQLSADQRSVDISFSYLWNAGHLTEKMHLTSRSISVTYEYQPDQDRNIRYFTGLLTLPFHDTQKPNLVGGWFRLGEPKGVMPLDQWGNPGKRFSSVSVRTDEPCTLDFLAEDSAWFFLWVNKTNDHGFLGLQDTGALWNNSFLKKGETLRLGYTLWIANENGTNLPDGTLKVKTP